MDVTFTSLPCVVHIINGASSVLDDLRRGGKQVTMDIKSTFPLASIPERVALIAIIPFS